MIQKGKNLHAGCSEKLSVFLKQIQGTAEGGAYHLIFAGSDFTNVSWTIPPNTPTPPLMLE
jgi:hypothetical protein